MAGVVRTGIFDHGDQQGGEGPPGLGEQASLEQHDIFAIAAIEWVSPVLGLFIKIGVAGPFYPIVGKRVDSVQFAEKVGREDDIARRSCARLTFVRINSAKI